MMPGSGSAAEELIRILKECNVELFVLDGALKYRGPKEIVASARQDLVEYKEDLLRLVPQRHSRALACGNCGKNVWRHEQLAYDGAGGDVCAGCCHAVRLDVVRSTASVQHSTLNI